MFAYFLVRVQAAHNAFPGRICSYKLRVAAEMVDADQIGTLPGNSTLSQGEPVLALIPSCQVSDTRLSIGTTGTGFEHPVSQTRGQKKENMEIVYILTKLNSIIQSYVLRNACKESKRPLAFVAHSGSIFLFAFTQFCFICSHVFFIFRLFESSTLKVLQPVCVVDAE